jgi:hypothetical protein
MSTFFARPQGNLLNFAVGKSTISLTPPNQMTAFKKSK